MPMWIVGVAGTCKRLAFCATETEAVGYIDSLPHAERGIYYIDGPCTGPIVVAEASVDDLPATAPEE